MKFYRMKNGDIVTNLRPIIGTTKMQATRVYNAHPGRYCFDEYRYADGIKARLSKAQAATLKNILNRLLHETKALPDPDELKNMFFARARESFSAFASKLRRENANV